MNKNSNSLLLTCKKLPISKTDFVPQINGTVKTVLLPDFLIVFNYNADPSEQILAFDLNEKQWLKTSLTGDKLILQPGSSVCPYDNNTIIIFGTSSDQKEGQLSLLTFCKASESDELIVDHDLISLQDRILVSRHSANIIGHFMFIYGGFVNSFASQELSYIDLRTLKITRACQQNGSLPGHLFDHRSIAIKNKIYIYGKLHIYVLDTTSFKWEKLDCGSKVYGTAQVFQDDIYFFGGTKEIPHNYLAIYNTSKNLWYDIAKRGDSPSPAGDYLSAIHENQIIIFDGKPAANTNQESADLKQMYSFSLVGRTGNDLIHEIALQKALKFGEANQDMRTLDSVTKMLEEKKEYDIVFIVQGKKIPAHKNILALRSPYFSNLFSSGMQESKQEEIVINEISSQAFKALLEYFYKGVLPSKEAILRELIVYTEKILVKKLRIHCEKTLIQSIKIENAIELYDISKMSGAGELEEASLQFIIKNIHHFADQLAQNLIPSQGSPAGESLFGTSIASRNTGNSSEQKTGLFGVAPEQKTFAFGHTSPVQTSGGGLFGTPKTPDQQEAQKQGVRSSNGLRPIGIFSSTASVTDAISGLFGGAKASTQKEETKTNVPLRTAMFGPGGGSGIFSQPKVPEQQESSIKENNNSGNPSGGVLGLTKTTSQPEKLALGSVASGQAKTEGIQQQKLELFGDISQIKGFEVNVSVSELPASAQVDQDKNEVQKLEG